MAWLVWGGAALVMIGLAGIVYSLLAVMGAKRAGLADEAMRDRLKGLVPVNIASLFIATFGLMVVITGLFLG